MGDGHGCVCAEVLDWCETGCLTRVTVESDTEGRPRPMGVIGCAYRPAPCELILEEHTPARCQQKRASAAMVRGRLEGGLARG